MTALVDMFPEYTCRFFGTFDDPTWILHGVGSSEPIALGQEDDIRVLMDLLNERAKNRTKPDRTQLQRWEDGKWQHCAYGTCEKMMKLGDTLAPGAPEGYIFRVVTMTKVLYTAKKVTR